MSSWPYANDVPTSPWRSAMSIPRELTLRETEEGLRMFQEPVRELNKLRGKKFQKRGATVSELNEWLRENQVAGPLWEIEIELDPASANAVEMELFAAENQQTVVRYDGKGGTVSINRTRSGNTQFHGGFPGIYTAPVRAGKDKTLLHLFVDTSSIELFANDGESVITALVLPKAPTRPIQFRADDPEFKISRFTAWKLKSAVPILTETAAKN
jgi:fructan beta-fructosidase